MQGPLQLALLTVPEAVQESEILDQKWSLGEGERELTFRRPVPCPRRHATRRPRPWPARAAPPGPTSASCAPACARRGERAPWTVHYLTHDEGHAWACNAERAVLTKGAETVFCFKIDSIYACRQNSRGHSIRWKTQQVLAGSLQLFHWQTQQGKPVMQSGHALAQAAIAQRGRVDGQPQQQRQHAPAQLQRGFVAGRSLPPAPASASRPGAPARGCA